MRAITSHLPDSNYTTNLVKNCCTNGITQRLSSFQLLGLEVDDIPILHRPILDGFISPIINFELIIRLLKVGADPHVRDVHGITPMHHAALQEPYRTSNSREFINLLLDKELSLSCKDNYGWSPPHLPGFLLISTMRIMGARYMWHRTAVARR
jgi:ankyrin repeat protein